MDISLKAYWILPSYQINFKVSLNNVDYWRLEEAKTYPNVIWISPDHVTQNKINHTSDDHTWIYVWCEAQMCHLTIYWWWHWDIEWRSAHPPPTHVQDTMLGCWKTDIQSIFQLSLTNRFQILHDTIEEEILLLRTNGIWPRVCGKNMWRGSVKERETTQRIDYCKRRC